MGKSSISLNFLFFYSLKNQTDFALEMGFDPKDVFDVEDNALFRAQIQENYLRLRIFFKTLDVTESVQTAKYTVSESGNNLLLFPQSELNSSRSTPRSAPSEVD